MAGKVEQLLTDGLLEGYAGKGNLTKITRSGFEGKSSHHSTKDTVYHDEWFTPNYLGGGQELAKIDDEMITRLYGGGTPDPLYLQNLGTSIREIGDFLKWKVSELGTLTRLFKDCKPEPDGDWQYIYEILQKDANIPIILASESVFYKKIHRVHWHPFIISSLR